jgi:hypothetical protein
MNLFNDFPQRVPRRVIPHDLRKRPDGCAMRPPFGGDPSGNV